MKRSEVQRLQALSEISEFLAFGLFGLSPEAYVFSRPPGRAKIKWLRDQIIFADPLVYLQGEAATL